MKRRPPRSKRTYTRFPYRTLCRSAVSKVMVVDQLPFMGIVYGPPGTTPESVRPTADRLRAGMVEATPEEFQKRLEAMTTAMVRNEEDRKSTRLNSRH